MLPTALALLLAARISVPGTVDAYLDRYFQMFPTRATEEGRHDLDRALEDLTPKRLSAWLAYNRQTRDRLHELLRESGISPDDRLDAQALLRHVDREIHDLGVRKEPARNPLYWTGLIGNATVFLLVREDLPRDDRIDRATSRAELIPRLAAQAQQMLGSTPESEIAPELCRIAASQARASAKFYGESFPHFANGEPPAESQKIRSAAAKAAGALTELAEFLDRLATMAKGSPRLGTDYAETFRLATGIDEPLERILADAEKDLAAKRAEAAAFGRTIWRDNFPGESPPADDTALLTRLLARMENFRAADVPGFVLDYKGLVDQVEFFIRQHKIMTLPDPMKLEIDRSPAYFVGQSVGGVYPAGPYEPDAATLFFLPTPPADATSAQKTAFFKDFNHHFNVMITPHEIMPGHAVQLRYAALNPHKVRAVFPDGVYVEGWGTFCERLMLDLGWGEPLDRLAHLKKQMENIARTIVDIRVHTQGMTRDEVVRFAEKEALQNDQFASNMWMRSIATPTQITTYYLGDRQVMGLYQDVKKSRGEDFDLHQFMDAMMQMGPVPVAEYRRRLLKAGQEVKGKR
jgi:uncharacterized protein (DUF885 family)